MYVEINVFGPQGLHKTTKVQLAKDQFDQCCQLEPNEIESFFHGGPVYDKFDDPSPEDE